MLFDSKDDGSDDDVFFDSEDDGGDDDNKDIDAITRPETDPIKNPSRAYTRLLTQCQYMRCICAV